MRTLEEIKKVYLSHRLERFIKADEIEYYHITPDLLKEWRNEKQYLYIQEFLGMCDKFEKEIDLVDDKPIYIEKICYLFRQAIRDNRTDDEIYDNYLDLFKKAYELNLFDYYTYKHFNLGENEYHSRRSFIYDYKNNIGKKYNYPNQIIFGYFPNLYYGNHMKVFEETLYYFMDVIYQKYGLYMQYAMKELVKFCKEYNLPYVDDLIKAHNKAKELNYPKYHKYKYQFVEPFEASWEDIE